MKTFSAKTFSSGLDADTVLYLNQLTTYPTPPRVAVIDTLVRALKTSGNWALLDRLWLLASETAQAGYVSLVNPTSTQITNVNNATFTVDRGIAGNDSNMYLNTNWNPATQGVNFVRDSASMFYYSRTNSAASSKNDVGAKSGTQGLLMNARNATSVMTGTINSLNAGSTGSNTNSSGLIDSIRTGASAVTSGRNGVSIFSTTPASIAIESYNLYIMAGNNAGTADSFTSRQYSLVAAGGGGVNRLSFYNIIQAYMTSIGAQV